MKASFTEKPRQASTMYPAARAFSLSPVRGRAPTAMLLPRK